MRGWLLNAALCAVLLAVPAWGQRGGGGGHGGGFHGGGGGYHGGGFAGGSRGGHWGGGYRGNGWGYGGYGYPGYGYGYRGYGYPGYGYGYRGYGYGYGWRRGWGYPGWGWGWSYPWWGASWYPWWGWNSWDDSYDNSYPSDTYAPSNYQAQPYPSSVYVNPAAPPGYSYAQQNQTQDEIDSLKDQVAQLRSQQEEKSALPTKPEPHERTVLVYRDGHTEQADNYAIVGKTLWVFNETRARRIALSELDLAATQRDNEDRGIDFIVPRASQPAVHHSQ